MVERQPPLRWIRGAFPEVAACASLKRQCWICSTAGESILHNT